MGERGQRRINRNVEEQGGAECHVELRQVEESEMIWGTIVYIVYAAILIGMGVAVWREVNESEE